jgi:hypothetical protein
MARTGSTRSMGHRFRTIGHGRRWILSVTPVLLSRVPSASVMSRPVRRPGSPGRLAEMQRHMGEMMGGAPAATPPTTPEKK